MNTIDVLKGEKECVLRNINGCNRNCGVCDLVLPDNEILAAYDVAISVLSVNLTLKSNNYGLIHIQSSDDDVQELLSILRDIYKSCDFRIEARTDDRFAIYYHKVM